MSEVVPPLTTVPPEVTTAYHTDIAAMLRAEYVRRFIEVETRLDTPGQSPIATLHTMLQMYSVPETREPIKSSLIKSLPAQTIYHTPFEDTTLQNMVQLPEKSMPYIERSCRSGYYDNVATKRLLEKFSGDIENHLDFYMTAVHLAVIALRNTPDSHLVNSRDYLLGQEARQLAIQALKKDASIDPGLTILPETRSLMRFNKSLYSIVTESETSREHIAEELAHASGALIAPREIERKPLPSIEPVVEEPPIEDLIMQEAERLGWKLLSPDVREALQEIETQMTTETNHHSNGSVYDRERLNFLYYLKNAWPEENGAKAKILALDLITTGKGMYLAVVLPARLPTGLLVWHCVADNPVTNNSLLVWRAEHGLTLDGNEIMFNWTDVFEAKKGRKHAVALGAKKMNHTPTLHTRVQDYLLKDVDSLLDQ